MPSSKPPCKRFTVSLPRQDYDALKELATSQKPPLTLQYLVRYAIFDLLKKHEKQQLTLNLKIDS